MKHLDSREFFASDEEFANFRPLIINNAKSDFFFRSASAVNNKYGRAETVKKIMEQKKIRTILDFSSINYRCKSYEFGFTLVQQVKKILDCPGPYIIQCDAGKKRTGFVCIVLESLSGTSYENIVADYMESYRNNNGFNCDKNPRLAENIRLQKIDSNIHYIANSDSDSNKIDLKEAAKKYLLKNGLSQVELMILQDALLK